MTSNHKLVCARAARQQFASAFQQAVRDYRGAKASAMSLRALEQWLPDGLCYLPLCYLYDEEVARFAWEGAVLKENAEVEQGHFLVMARTRPLSEAEVPLYESVSSEGANRSVVVHDGRVHRDGRTIYTNHSRFCLDEIFAPDSSDAAVYRAAAQPLLRKCLKGGRSSLIFFGQTGTGKTYTARKVLEMMSKEIFEEIEEVEICCYEMAGTRGGREAFFDLLNDRNQVKCLTGEDGDVHVRGARKLQCGSLEELETGLSPSRRSFFRLFHPFYILKCRSNTW